MKLFLHHLRENFAHTRQALFELTVEYGAESPVFAVLFWLCVPFLTPLILLELVSGAWRDYRNDPNHVEF